jgi:hypothetical protein
MSENNTNETKPIHMPGSMAGRIGRLAILILSPVLAAAGLFYIYSYNPNVKSSLYIPCIIYETTGLYCPGCGNTRALHALVHLDFWGAIQNNLLFIPLFALLFWLLLGEYLKLLLGRRVLWVPKKYPLAFIIVFAVAVVAFTILRNFPIPPFTWLAPGL